MSAPLGEVDADVLKGVFVFDGDGGDIVGVADIAGHRV